MLTYQWILVFQSGMLFGFALQSFGRSALVNHRIDIHFWLGLTLLAGTAYTSSQMALSFELPGSTMLILHRLKLAFLLISVTGWVFCVYSIYFPASTYPRFFATIAGFIFIITPFNIFLSAPVTTLNVRVAGIEFIYHYGKSGPAYLLMVFLILIMFSLLPILRFLGTPKLGLGARLTGALSFLPGIIGGLNDFAVTSGYLNSIMISEYVFFLFLAVISVYIATEDMKTVRRLANLNDELEQSIQERTKDLETSNRKLQAMATTDLLTGLCNRHQFVQLLAHEEDRIERYKGIEGNSFALLFIDLDNFKYYNDNFGHAAGDLVLRLFADLLRNTLRTSDTAARYGGDEFLVLLPNTLETDALKLAHRILEKIEAASGYVKEITQLMEREINLPREQYLGCSIGLTSYDLASGQSSKDLLVAADQALYKAKTSGKNCVKIWRGRDSAVSESCQ